MTLQSHVQFLPVCSVVICTRDRAAQLEHCLSAVSRQDYPRFFSVVVDNASRDDSAREIAARWKARFVVESVPGLSRARNRGAAAFDSEIVAYLDDDSIPATDWLSNIVEGFRDPSVLVVTGRVCSPNKEEGAGALPELLIRHYEFGGSSPLLVDSSTPGWFELVHFQGVGIGANMAFRRRAFEVWDGFDTRLGRGALIAGEEVHAFSTLIARGYKLLYTPDAVVQHPYLATKQTLWTRYLPDLGANVAFRTLLFVEEPRYRKAILAFKWRSLVKSFRGPRREVRWHGEGTRDYVRTLLSRLSGPWLYLRSRRARSR